MHYHLTEPQLFVAGFLLLLGIIFVLAAFLELRAEKLPPFRSLFSAGLDRNLFANVAFSEPEIPRADRNTVFANIDGFYPDSSRDRTETRDVIQASHD